MKSIKNQYIDLKEGKMTEAQFMRNVRMSLPQYISNVTLFKQAEKILINKGIISEIKAPITEATDSELEELKNLILQYVKDPNDAEIQINKYIANGFKGLDDDVQANLMRDEKFTSWVQKGHDEETFRSETGDIPGFEGTLDALDKISINEAFKVKDSKEGYYNQDGKEQYGKFDEVDNMNAQEVMAGYVMEKQDNPELEIREAIKLVIKNLKKDPYYYTNYKLTGVRDEKPVEFTSSKRKSGFDQMELVDKNGNNFVDEKNKMQVIKEGLDNSKVANKIWNELQKQGSYSSKDIDEKIKSYRLNDKDADIVRAIIFDKDKEEMNESLDNKSIADKIWNELQKLGSYSSADVDKKIKAYNLNDKDADIVRVIIFDKDKEEMNESPISEAAKGKLKELVRKMMKEMFDGRDNMTDVTGEND